ncbi:hypothetical protein [Ulvibacterium sp.]|uniref:hypothetical protein n=1 Tax=Ulvibacterium sp. TaxID=2665914 RepID=UPI002627AAC8|nr:hypothetical protein [Ulvibacterium sp.]
MKFSKKYERDYHWYLSVIDVFSFDGTEEYHNNQGVDLIQFDRRGRTAKECFYLYDSNGIIKPTCEPEKLKALYKTKGSVNLHIKMFAKDRAKGYLPRIEFEKMCKEFNVPDWFVVAVENQKEKYYE